MANEWIKWTWTEENQYPENSMCEVFIMIDGLGIQPLSDYVENWRWTPDGKITHYRIAENEE